MKKGLYYKEVFFLLLPLCLGLIIVIDLDFIVSKDYYRPELDFNFFLQLSKELGQYGKMWQTALYPPGVPLMLAIIQLIGIEIDHFIFKSVLLILWLLTAYLLSRDVHGKNWYSFFSVLGMVLHPYFIWTGLMSKDSAAECLFLFLSYLLLMKLYSSHIRGLGINTLIVAGIFMLLSLTSLIRVTNFFILFALLGVLLILSQEKTQKYIFSILLSAFLLFTLSFCFYNYKYIGSFTLSTNLGINTFIGNNKAYLHGHPKYDIDIFFKTENFDTMKTKIEPLSEAQRNNYLIKEGLSAIQSDIPAFIYRCIVKSFWHWFNIEKIPNYPAPGTYLTEDGTKIQIGDIIILQSLTYAIYKLFYLPLFIISLYLMFTGKMKREYSAFFIPYFALWPIVIITFPDTRFKISAEILALIPMMESVKYLVAKWGNEGETGKMYGYNIH